MAQDFRSAGDELTAEELSDETRDTARLTVARHATDAGDCMNLLRMLGLAERPKRSECPECSGPLSLQTISGKCGLRNFCSARCRDAAKRAGR